MKTIEIDPFDYKSVSRAITALENYKKWIEEKGMELCERLADIGMEVASINFSGGFIDNNEDVEVSVHPLNNGYEIVASGQSVCFLEFGAGLAAGNGYDTSLIDPPVPIEQGSYSDAVNGPYAKNGYKYWYDPDGKYHTMVVPRMGMAHAVSEIQRRITEVANEVFRD